MVPFAILRKDPSLSINKAPGAATPETKKAAEKLPQPEKSCTLTC